MSYISSNGKIELKVIGYEEPNNGRELHVAELFVNGENATGSFFKNGWNRLNINLSNLMFESPDERFVFIPAEGNSFVINTNTLRSAFLPYKGISTVLFQGNEFIAEKIVLHYSDELVEIDLEELFS